MNKIINIKKIMCMLLVLSFVLAACSSNEVRNKVSFEELNESVQIEIFETESSVKTEAVEINTEELRDTVVMNYDKDAVLIEGNKIISSNDSDYDLNNLMPICAYEETGVKLYAYEDPEMGVVGYPFNRLKLLLFHDGKYQVFEQTEFLYLSNMFGYCDEKYPYEKDFDKGYEKDFDNDGSLELVRFITTDYGSGILQTDIVVFDYNDDVGEYEAYHIGDYYFRDLIYEAMTIFFDEYYCPYTVDERGIYRFENGFEVCYGLWVDCFVDDNGEIIMGMEIHGDPRNDGSMNYYIGYLDFKVDYIGEGRFSVRALSYAEEKNIMDPNADLW